MKLFKCHAVMPLLAHEGTHVVKMYVVAADSWECARALVRDEEPFAEFVTMPVETLAVLLAEVASMSAQEFADLRSACNWREKQTPMTACSVPYIGPRDVGSKGKT
jgi:hypothetical protein